MLADRVGEPDPLVDEVQTAAHQGQRTEAMHMRNDRAYHCRHRVLEQRELRHGGCTFTGKRQQFAPVPKGCVNLDEDRQRLVFITPYGGVVVDTVGDAEHEADRFFG